MRCDVIRRTEGRICVATLPYMVGEAVWCVERFGPDHGWKIVESII